MVKKLLRKIHQLVLETEDLVRRWSSGRLHLPPRRLRDVGGDDLDDFVKVGQEFVRYFREICDLSPSADVLEIGCGCGRIALPLTTYLSVDGSYTGVEIVRPSVDWCNRTLARRFANFTFLHADLYNKRYNPGASTRARDYCFPFADASFDFIYLTSVFTHLLPGDLEHYLEEIRRLIRRDGQVLATFFLLNQEQRQLAVAGRNAIDFLETGSWYMVRDHEVPESAVAYEEDRLLAMVTAMGFRLVGPVRHGTWSGREDGLSFQDIVVLTTAQGN